jgi:ubiquitin
VRPFVCGGSQARGKPFSLLDLGRNAITALPAAFTDLHDGVRVRLGNNPLVAPPSDIATQGLARIKQWFADQHWMGATTFVAKTRKGKVIQLEVEPSDTIATVKAKIEATERIPQGSQQLIVAGRELADTRTLATYNIHRHDGFVAAESTLLVRVYPGARQGDEESSDEESSDDWSRLRCFRTRWFCTRADIIKALEEGTWAELLVRDWDLSGAASPTELRRLVMRSRAACRRAPRYQRSHGGAAWGDRSGGADGPTAWCAG